jgi:hypothetical protein
VSFVVLGRPGATVAVTGWSVAAIEVCAWHPDATAVDRLAGGGWRHEVVVGPNGWTRFEIRLS